MPFISIKDLNFEYTRIDEDGKEIRHKAIDDISFDVEEGEFVAILGMNGSGKSTLAKTLNGLLVPTSGDVVVSGLNTKDDDHIWDVRSQIAMVFQNPDNQIVSSIVEDDVAFGPENLGVPPQEIRVRVDQALKAVGMYEHRNKGAHMLSGGQKQRVAIAGAVAMQPKCIIFDEPTAMLDPKGRSQVMYIIRELNKAGITTILITHFMEEATDADRIIVMKAGKVYSDSTPEDFFCNRELITQAGMEMPAAIDLRERLLKRGIKIDESIMTSEDLVTYVVARCKEGN